MWLCAGGHTRHHRGDTSRALSPLRANTALAPPPARTHGPLGRIMCRCSSCTRHKRPPGVAPREALPTPACGLGHAAPTAGVQPPLDLPPHRGHRAANTHPFACPIAHPMPPVTHLMRVAAQGFPALVSSAPASPHGVEVAQQMRPAPRPPAPRRPGVRAQALGDQETSTRRAQACAHPLAPPRQTDQTHRDPGAHGPPHPARWSP